jgi:hypothetical protein
VTLSTLVLEVALTRIFSVTMWYGLAVVLFTVLVFSGIGSLLTERFLRADRPLSQVAPLALLMVALVAFGIATPEVIHAADGATTPARIATAVGLLAPLSLLMGMPFALGMRAAAATPGAPRAFLWGINGATSVCASVFGVVLALFLGINAAFWAGTIAYSLALAAMLAIVGGARRSAGAEATAKERLEHAQTVHRG